MFSASSVVNVRAVTTTEWTLPSLASRTFVDQSANLSSLLVESNVTDSFISVNSHVVSSLDKPAFDSAVPCHSAPVDSQFVSCELSSVRQMLFVPTPDENHTISVIHIAAPTLLDSFGNFHGGDTTRRLHASTQDTVLRTTWLPQTAAVGLQAAVARNGVITVETDWMQAFGANVTVEMRVMVSDFGDFFYGGTESLMDIDENPRWVLAASPVPLSSENGTTSLRFDVRKFVQPQYIYQSSSWFAPVVRSPTISFALDTFVVVTPARPYSFPPTVYFPPPYYGSYSSRSGPDYTFHYVGGAGAFVAIGGAAAALHHHQRRKRRIALATAAAIANAGRVTLVSGGQVQRVVVAPTGVRAPLLTPQHAQAIHYPPPPTKEESATKGFERV